MKINILTCKEDIYKGIEIWNFNNEKLQIRDEIVRQNLFAPFSGVNIIALGLKNRGELVGFAVIKYLNSPIVDYTDQTQGWISLLSISEKEDIREDNVQGEDNNTKENIKKRTEKMLSYIEELMLNKGITDIRFGGDPQNFLPGLPFSLKDKYFDILIDNNYQQGSIEYDLYRNISNFDNNRGAEESEKLAVRRVTAGEKEQLYSFLNRNFPGRWLYEAKNIGKLPGGINDYWLLWYQDQPAGFARSNMVDSIYQGPNINWAHQHGELYCGIGPLGIASRFRKKGWGLYLIAKIIEQLRDEGYQHMEIDWTTLVDYYQKLGFEACRKYITLTKKL